MQLEKKNLKERQKGEGVGDTKWFIYWVFFQNRQKVL